MKGRKPKPTEQRKLEGNAGNRPLNIHEPVLPAAQVTLVPDELKNDLVATAEWERLAPMLRKAKVLTDGDRGALIALCLEWSRYLYANARVVEQGMVIAAPSGYPVPNPYIGIGNRAFTNCKAMMAEIGLTPTARSRVVAKSEEDGDPFAEFEDPPGGAPQSH